jgi:integrase/recombinase XerD
MARLKVIEQSPSTPLRSLADDWLGSVRAGGKSVRTLEAYRWPVYQLFLPFCAEQGVERPDQLDQRILDRFTTSLLDKVRADGKPLSKASVASYSRSVRVFLGYVRSQGETVAGKPKVPTAPKKVVATLERTEIEAMENAAETERDRLIIRVLGNTGLRLGELLGLRPADLIQNDRGWFLKVRGKGDKERLVPLRPPAVARRLRKYADRDRHDAASDRIFLTIRRSRRTGLYEPLERRTVEQMMKGVAERAKVDPTRAYPHAMRHSFATWALRSGMNALMLQEVLGHADLTMISRNYSHVRAEDAADHLARLLEQ